MTALECREVIVKNPSTDANHGGALFDCHWVIF